MKEEILAIADEEGWTDATIVDVLIAALDAECDDATKCRIMNGIAAARFDEGDDA